MILLVPLLLGCSGAGPQAQAPNPADPLAAMRASTKITVTRHGECRMACRKITMDEVKSVLATGRWDPKRTRNDGECTSHALEGPDSEGGPLRIVFADCPDATRVVTAIDLDDKHPCDCD